MKYYIILCACLSGSVVLHAQAVVLFKDPKGNRYTQQQADSILAGKNKQIQSLEMVASREITGKESVGDTVFYLYKINISNVAVQQNDEKKSRYVNMPLPSFSFTSLDGKNISSDKLKGKPIIINMWFTTCAPCIAEMPQLNALKTKYSNTDIVFLSMTYESKASVTAFLKEHPFDFTAIPAVKEYCEKFTENYPINIFVDRSGIVRDVQNGMPLIYDAQAKKVSDKADPGTFEKALMRIL